MDRHEVTTPCLQFDNLCSANLLLWKYVVFLPRTVNSEGPPPAGPSRIYYPVLPLMHFMGMVSSRTRRRLCSPPVCPYYEYINPRYLFSQRHRQHFVCPLYLSIRLRHHPLLATPFQHAQQQVHNSFELCHARLFLYPGLAQ